jgi:hypothetical protein
MYNEAQEGNPKNGRIAIVHIAESEVVLFPKIATGPPAIDLQNFYFSVN